MQDIAQTIGRAKITEIVAAFYADVRRHPTLAQPFERVQDWPHHLEHLSHFWWVSLGGARYRNTPYLMQERHALAGFTPALLADWLLLFRACLYKHLPAHLADSWMERAERIGTSLSLMHDLGHLQIVAPGSNTLADIQPHN